MTDTETRGVTAHHKQHWEARAACRGDDPELWFSDHPDDKNIAKDICRQCTVIAQCRTKGADERYGIWGGIDELERGGCPDAGTVEGLAAHKRHGTRQCRPCSLLRRRKEGAA